MLCVTGTPIKNGQIEALFEACQLPSKLAVVKCEAHTSHTDKIAIGNRQALVRVHSTVNKQLDGV